MNIFGCNVGVAVTGSFCTLAKIHKAIQDLVERGARITPIFSDSVQSIDSRFGKAEDWMKAFSELSDNPAVRTIQEAEPLGPKNLLDILLIAPCTGNTLAKLTNGVTDTPVLMAAKGHLRNNKPVVIFLSSNDSLGSNLKNIGLLMNTKHIFFVPFGQDSPAGKPNSMVSHTEQIIPALEAALEGKQVQPVIQTC